jgi:hypothetical protein
MQMATEIDFSGGGADLPTGDQHDTRVLRLSCAQGRVMLLCTD